MKYVALAFTVVGILGLASPASAQGGADSLVGSGTHAKGDGGGPDGLGTPAPKGTVGNSGSSAEPKVLGGNTSTLGVTTPTTPTLDQKAGVAQP